jgi:hypothetical protein
MQHYVTIAVMQVMVMGGCIQNVMDLSFRMGNCIKSEKWQMLTVLGAAGTWHFYLHKYHTMVYVVLFPGTVTEDAAVMTSLDKTFLMMWGPWELDFSLSYLMLGHIVRSLQQGKNPQLRWQNISWDSFWLAYKMFLHNPKIQQSWHQMQPILCIMVKSKKKTQNHNWEQMRLIYPRKSHFHVDMVRNTNWWSWWCK